MGFRKGKKARFGGAKWRPEKLSTIAPAGAQHSGGHSHGIPITGSRPGALRRSVDVPAAAAGQARRRAYRRMKTKAYAVSQRVRKRVEEIFGWMKTVGDLARTRFVGRWKILQEMLVTGAAYNLLRLVRLTTPATG